MRKFLFLDFKMARFRYVDQGYEDSQLVHMECNKMGFSTLQKASKIKNCTPYHSLNFIHSFFMNQSLIQQPVHVYCC